MKISIITGVWKRPDIFKMFAKGVHNLNHDINVIVAGSEGAKSRKMVENEGFIYIEIANQPLATKMNATALKAKELDSDYTICMGSDDVLSPELFQHYLKWMKKGYDFIGIQDMYFYDVVSGKAQYWGGYRERNRFMHSAGAGRCISKHLMNKWQWLPWKVKHNDFLDNSMQGRINGTQKILNIKSLGVYALDIKSPTNMTPYKRWDNTADIDPEIIKKEFDYIFE